MITLTQQGTDEPLYTTTVKGTDTEYMIPNVAFGTYTVTVSKNDVVIGEYTLVVEEDSVQQDVALGLKGDLSGDGKVNITDAVMLYYHVNGKKLLEDTSGADLTADGKINITDAVRLYYFVNGKIENL